MLLRVKVIVVKVKLPLPNENRRLFTLYYLNEIRNVQSPYSISFPEPAILGKEREALG